MFKLKFLLIAIFAIVCCFFAATFFMNWDTALVEKNLADAETTIKSVLQTKSREVALKHCPQLIKTLNDGIPQFVKKGRLAEQAKSIKLISDCQIAMKDYQRAAASFAKLARMEPQASRWHGQMAEALFHQRRDGEALRAAHLASQLTPTDYKWPLLEARIMRRMQMREEALAAYKNALALAPYAQAQQISIELNAMSGADNNDK